MLFLYFCPISASLLQRKVVCIAFLQRWLLLFFTILPFFFCRPLSLLHELLPLLIGYVSFAFYDCHPIIIIIIIIRFARGAAVAMALYNAEDPHRYTLSATCMITWWKLPFQCDLSSPPRCVSRFLRTLHCARVGYWNRLPLRRLSLVFCFMLCLFLILARKFYLSLPSSRTSSISLCDREEKGKGADVRACACCCNMMTMCCLAFFSRDLVSAFPFSPCATRSLAYTLQGYTQ